MKQNLKTQSQLLDKRNY